MLPEELSLVYVHILIDWYGGGVVGGVKPCVVRSCPDLFLFPQQFWTGIPLYTLNVLFFCFCIISTRTSEFRLSNNQTLNLNTNW